MNTTNAVAWSRLEVAEGGDDGAELGDVVLEVAEHLPESASVSRMRIWVMVTRPTMPMIEIGSSSAMRRSIPPTSPLRVPWTIPARTNSTRRLAPMPTVVA
jgi:hypothetical protein